MILLYILKSSIYLSIFLTSYYLFFKKDKWFVFNRFYLIAAVLISLIAPMVNVSISNAGDYIDESHFQFVQNNLTLIEQSNFVVTTSAASEINSASTYIISLLIYFLGVALMMARYLNNLVGIRKLYSRSSSYQLDGISLVLVVERISPFCFGCKIFLNQNDFQNNRIDRDIIRHESVHAKHLHTIDVVVIETLLIFFWFNPLLWAFRSMIKINHEYCADDYVIREESNLEQYGNKLLGFIKQENYPLQASGFDYSIIKNRITMMNRSRSSYLSFGSKFLVSLTALVFTLITMSMQLGDFNSYLPEDSSVFTVVVDPGHGGIDLGSGDPDQGILEKEIVLDIAKAIAKTSDESSVRIILTRNSDVMMTLRDRAQIAKTNGADLFISLHVNRHHDSTVKGLEVYYSEQNRKSNLSKHYSTMFAQGLESWAGSATIKTGDFAVLNNLDCPAVLLELGFISNTQDLQLLSSKANHQSIAKQMAQIILGISKM